jgi:hypothetical protein
MITKEEYWAAMAVVEKYHAQLISAISTAERLSGVTVREFVRDVEISFRLRNVLSYFIELGCTREICLEELDRNMMSKFRNSGRKTWDEFTNKRDKYMQKRLSN